MKLPKVILKDELEAVINEWTLGNVRWQMHDYTMEDPPYKEIIVRLDEELMMVEGAEAAYVQRSDGHWVDIPYTEEQDCEKAVEIANNYEIQE